MAIWIWKTLSSLKLTVTLLALSLVVVFFGTLDQVEHGIRHTQELYFSSWIAWTPVFELFFGFLRLEAAEGLGWLIVPFPGGSLLGVLFMVNLACAHFRYFKPSWKKSGIAMIHGGLVMLLISAFITDFRQRESMMSIDEGGSTAYSTARYINELVLIDKTDPETDRVVSIPESLIRSGKVIRSEELPFEITVHRYFKDSLITMVNPQDSANAEAVAVNRKGQPVLAKSVLPDPQGVLARQPLRIQEDRPNTADERASISTAFVTLEVRDEVVGSWMLSNVFEGNFPSQVFNYEGKSWEIELRLKRYYHGFALQLEDFRFDRYPGTEIPRNFSSDVTIEHPGEPGDGRDVRIYMNHPLRYGGLTFYQASFDDATEATTVLQVVRNEGWLLPYFAVAIVGLGLCVQFGVSLIVHANRRRS